MGGDLVNLTGDKRRKRLISVINSYKVRVWVKPLYVYIKESFGLVVLGKNICYAYVYEDNK